MVSDLAEQGVLERREDEADRRRAVITIAAANKSAVEDWLANGAAAWRLAFEPLTPAEREPSSPPCGPTSRRWPPPGRRPTRRTRE